MGCDIHAYLEYYDTKVDQAMHNRADCYSSEISFGRNYSLFNLLAGVRGVGAPVFDRREIPSNPDVSFEVENRYFMTVVDEAEYPKSNTISFQNGTFYGPFGDKYILREYADKAVSSGSSWYHHDKYKIKDPNWHSASHLFMKELIEIRRRYLIDTLEYESTEYKGKKRKDAISTIKNSNEYELMKVAFPSIECVKLNATIASMIAIENSGDYISRLVFWFDS